MRQFKSIHQAQRFLGTHAAVYNLFNQYSADNRNATGSARPGRLVSRPQSLDETIVDLTDMPKLRRADGEAMTYLLTNSEMVVCPFDLKAAIRRAG